MTLSLCWFSLCAIRKIVYFFVYQYNAPSHCFSLSCFANFELLVLMRASLRLFCFLLIINLEISTLLVCILLANPMPFLRFWKRQPRWLLPSPAKGKNGEEPAFAASKRVKGAAVFQRCNSIIMFEPKNKDFFLLLFI
uniref:(northern house mosquito) hypothetical protein n=1 Tax=Culex pipiens TaxID=7175 RepID=A0A8D8HJK4_CULPI